MKPTQREIELLRLYKVPHKKKHVIKFHSRGESGNIYVILSKVYAFYDKQKRNSEFEELRARVYGCHNYESALGVIREVVDLVDLDGRY